MRPGVGRQAALQQLDEERLQDVFRVLTAAGDDEGRPVDEAGVLLEQLFQFLGQRLVLSDCCGWHRGLRF